MNYQNVSYSDTKRMHDNGLMTDREWKRYVIAWTWSTGRFGGKAGRLQDAFYNSRGKPAYIRRVVRMRRVLGLVVIEEMVKDALRG
jgi:hypothetical protein